MKSLFAFVFAISSIVSFAHASCNPEAQFEGSVTKLTLYPATLDKAEHFTFQVKIGDLFYPSGTCPMLRPELEAAVVEFFGQPAYSEGDSVSGVMVRDYSTGAYQIIE